MKNLLGMVNAIAQQTTHKDLSAQLTTAVFMVIDAERRLPSWTVKHMAR